MQMLAILLSCFLLACSVAPNTATVQTVPPVVVTPEIMAAQPLSPPVIRRPKTRPRKDENPASKAQPEAPGPLE